MSFPGKKGIGMTLNNNTEEKIALVVSLQPYWNYSWNLKCVDEQPDDIEFVPMVYGAYNLSILEDKISDAIGDLVSSGKVKRLLGFNEPDNSDQANLDVFKALAAWPSLESSGLPLASPACVQADGEWMCTFTEGIKENNGRMDYIAVHWYGGTSFTSFKSSLSKAYNLHGGNIPLIITEFAPADWSASTPEENKHTPEDVLSFMKQALPWLEAQDWIAAYAWFPFNINSKQGTSSALFDSDGNLTAVGKYYASVRSDCTDGDQSIAVE